MLSLSIMRLVAEPGRIAAGRILFEGTDLLGAAGGGDAGDPRQPDRHDLPGADDEPQPGL